MDRLVKLIIVAVVLFLLWTKGVPWLKSKVEGTSGPPSSKSTKASCADRAQTAFNRWADGLGSFVSPPYDTAAWSSFRSEVEGAISRAESECGCARDSCSAARDAMGNLRRLLSDVDSAINAGTPPPMDVPQNQERVENGINEASSLEQQGK